MGHDPGDRAPRRVDLDDVAVAQDGGYLVPLKVAVRRAEGIDVGDVVTVGLTVGE